MARQRLGGRPVIAAVEGRGLEKAYGVGETAVQVLTGVDLRVERSELVSVMGPSGSGKSTLLHLLGGLDVPDAGDVLLDGQPLSALTDDQRAALRAEHVGIVYQFFNLVPVLTVAENVALPAVIAGQRPATYRHRVDELLELVGLTDHRSKLPSQLSGGQQQRVAIARALFARPTVLLADEPTGNLDMETGAGILELFVRARHEFGQSILMVTHDAASAACGDRVLLLREGDVADQLDLRTLPTDAASRTDAVLGLLAGRATAPRIELVEDPPPQRRPRRRRPLRAAPDPTA